MTTSANAGTIELRDSYPKNLQSGLLTAGIIHTLIVGAMLLGPAEEVKKIEMEYRDPFPLKNFITYQQFTFSPASRPKLAANTAGIGTPVPIPDPEINPERTIPDEGQIGSATGMDSGTEGGIGGESGNGEGMNTGAMNDELPPKEFLPGVEKYPVAVSSPSPVYPDIARRSGIEGTVFVKMWVTRDGSVRTAEVVKSSSELFDQASIEAAKRWKFTPAIMNNSPVSVFVTVPFKFRLHAG